MISKETCVSIHAPARGATQGHHAGKTMMMFQSTLPRGERPSTTNCPRRNDRFNPRSRAGSDRGPLEGSRFRKVSIHAPARGATSQGQGSYPD